jgi:zinc protease
MKKLVLLPALALLALSPAAYAENAAPAATASAETPWLYEGSDVPVDTSWTFGKLDNGLKYAVKKNVVPAGQVSIRVRIDAGALYEEDSEQGFAHLLEHIAFRGSEYVPDGESKRIWQRLGVSFGSDSNAQTTPTQTSYKLDLPAADPPKIDESMKIISGMMRAPNISDTALNAERAIVLAELREISGADTDFRDAMRAHLFQGQRMEKLNIIGTPETLNAANAARLSAFHKRWYRPDKTVIVIAGDAEPEVLIDVIQRNFGNWRSQEPASDQPDFGQPKAEGKIATAKFDPTLPPSVTMMLVRPWQQMQDSIAYNQDILIEGIATAIVNRRLEEQARKSTSFTLASLSTEKIARSADVTFVAVKPYADNWEKALLDVRALIDDALKTPPSVADIEREVSELQRIVNTRVEKYPFEAASVQAESIINAVDIRETVASPQTVADVFAKTRPRFTPQEVYAATKRILTAVTSRVVVSAPTAMPDAETRMAKALVAPIAAAKGARLAEKNIGFDKLPKLGSAGKVVSSQIHERFGMESLEFSNGTRALLWPNAAEAEQVRVLVRFGRGFQSVDPEKGGPFWSGPMVLSDTGIGKLDRTKLDQLMNGRRLELSFGVDSDAFEWTAATRPQDLADQLMLIATKMEAPGWQAAPVERAKAVAAADYDSFSMTAIAMMQRDLQYLTSGKDARWKTPTPAEIKTLTPKAFRAFWEPLLANGPVEVLLFGDFERSAAVAALEKSFGAMKKRIAGVVPQTADTTNFPAAVTAPQRLTHKGPKDQAAAVIAWPTGGGLAGISEGRELEILAAVFRDRLFEKFRSEQAASYSPDMQNNWPDRFRSGGYLMAYSQVQPKDLDRFYAFASEVAADLKKNPISADELQRATEPLKQFIERVTTGNLFWMNQLEGATYTPQRFTVLARLYSDYNGVTAARVQELARKYFRDDKAWKLVVEPER